MLRNAKCVVPHCGQAHHVNKECIYARFPREPGRCREWLWRVGVKDLIYLSLDKLNGIRFVCGCHFEVDQFFQPSRKKLKPSVIPSLFGLRVNPLDEELLADFPLSDVAKIPTEDIYYPF